MDCSLLSSSVHGDSPGRNTGYLSLFLLSIQETNFIKIMCLSGQTSVEMELWPTESYPFIKSTTILTKLSKWIFLECWKFTKTCKNLLQLIQENSCISLRIGTSGEFSLCHPFLLSHIVDLEPSSLATTVVVKTSDRTGTGRDINNLEVLKNDYQSSHYLNQLAPPW